MNRHRGRPVVVIPIIPPTHSSVSLPTQGDRSSRKSPPPHPPPLALNPTHPFRATRFPIYTPAPARHPYPHTPHFSPLSPFQHITCLLLPQLVHPLLRSTSLTTPSAPTTLHPRYLSAVFCYLLQRLWIGDHGAEYDHNTVHAQVVLDRFSRRLSLRSVFQRRQHGGFSKVRVYNGSLISCRRIACPFLYSRPIRNLSYLLHRPVPQSTFDLSTHSTHVVLTRIYRLLLTRSVIKCLRLFRIFKLVKFMDKFKFANLWRMFRLFASLAGLCHFLGCFWVSARITGASTRVE